MKIKYFSDTDTLYVELRESSIAETRDLDENTVAEYDDQGNLCAITIEHAKQRADSPDLLFEQIAA
jgi:uncharacterized protein YuzE